MNRSWRIGLVAGAGLALAGFMPLENKQTPGGETPWEVVDMGSAKIAVPRTWRRMDKMRPEIPVFRQSSGGAGVPSMDDTMSAFKLSISVVQKISSTDSAEYGITDELALLKNDKRLEQVGKETIEQIRLTDNSPALLMKAEFIKDKTERQVQYRLAAKDVKDNLWIVSGTVVGGKQSKWASPKGKYAIWLEAQVRSLTFGRFDEAAIKAAYEAKDSKK